MISLPPRSHIETVSSSKGSAVTTTVCEAVSVGELVGIFVEAAVGVEDATSVAVSVGSGVGDSDIEFLHIVKSKAQNSRTTFVFPGIRSQYRRKDGGSYGAVMSLV